jgi:hypothetical protein
MNQKRTVGFWVIMVTGILAMMMFFLGQTLALFFYDFTVSLGLQESKEVVTEMGVALNKGFAVSDTIIYLPLFAVGLIGLWKRTIWGVFAMAGVFAITAYWPIVCWSTLFFAKGIPGFTFQQFTSYSILLGGLTLYGVWGFWYVYRYRALLADKHTQS